MSDWLDKLEQEFRRKKDNERAETERTTSHDRFINDHGFESWKELMAKVALACERLSSGSVSPLSFRADDNDCFTVAGGTRLLEVSFDPRTKGVNWDLRDTPNRGTLNPCLVNDSLVYRNERNELLYIEHAAAFLMHKVF